MGLGFAVFAGTSPEVIRASAKEAERLGYTSFWVNDPGPTDGLAALAHAARETQRIELGIGVIPLHTRADRRASSTGVKTTGLPLERLLLGVGSPNPEARARARRHRRAAAPAPDAAHRGGARSPRCAGSPARSPTACSSTGSRPSTRVGPPSWCVRARPPPTENAETLRLPARRAGSRGQRAAPGRRQALRVGTRLWRQLRSHGPEAR